MGTVIAAAALAASCACGINGESPWPVVDSRSATVEVSHVYNEDGDHVLSQLIWWDADIHVIAWRLLSRDTQLPVGGQVIYFDRVLRRVRAASEHRTWRQYDPEIDDRAVLPVEQRIGLGE